MPNRLSIRPWPNKIPLLFGLTIFASACLLFLVQPLASKLILPWFGGSATVWTTCLLFFQAGLLLGYLYAHVLVSRLTPKRQRILHSALLLLSLAALPILPNPVWQPHPGEDPAWRVLGVLSTSIGIPYLLLSSTSPLLQSWYFRFTDSAIPYRYFALSNAGSLIALLSYPVLFEPYLTTHRQAWIWSFAFVLFAALTIAVAVMSRRATITPDATYPAHPPPRSLVVAHPTTRSLDILFWLLLPASASALLLAVTDLLTQNVAPMPLLWVVPLGTYLLTFVLCFDSAKGADARRQPIKELAKSSGGAADTAPVLREFLSNNYWYKRPIFLPLVLPAAACLAVAIGSLTNPAIALAVPLFTAALFVCAMACHGELARLKPSPEHLTTFYLCIAAGGTLGGLFVALLAPHLFPAMYELPISLVSCPLILLAVLWRERHSWPRPDPAFTFWLAALALTIVLAAYAGRQTWFQQRFSIRLARNFYGALRVDELEDRHQLIRQLTHGTITHGIQFRKPNLRNIPTTYYAWDSGIGLAWQALAPSGPLRMGIVGLGAGTLAAYGRAGDTLRFYEINPLVISIARTQFTYLADCPSHLDIVLGDARLSLTREPDQQFDLLVIDAFSGDAIPIHLLTLEAFHLYWRHLKPDGVLAVHVSNHYVNLAPVVKLAAMAMHKEAWQVDNYDYDAREEYTSTYVLVSNRAGFFDDPLFIGEFLDINIPTGLKPWTDDYSNLWQVLNLK